MNKIAVVGGGASGIASAISAARGGARVTILEKNARIGKKILSTGNGRCNYSNKNVGSDSYNSTFVCSALEKFSHKDTVDFFKEIGMLTAFEEGRAYPKSMQASALLDVLRFELERLDVSIISEFDAECVSKKSDKFVIKSREGRFFECGKVIMATGGMAAPKTGSSGEGYTILKNLGHTITSLKPALCFIKTDKGIQGVRQSGRVTLQNGVSREGELQFAKDALSGIPIFGISRYIEKGDSIFVDLLPEMDPDDVVKYLLSRPNQPMESYLVGILNKALGQFLLKDIGISPLSRISKSLTTDEIYRIANTLKSWEFIALESASWENAQVTAGGVVLSEVDSNTMESKLVKGLYITGELLDIDADCGGYNLQWAWSSGMLAGREAANV